ncbi:cell wall-active antibiotics response protein LiaF [Exiguobacterium flavidum]|uniref:cell wall-active antibiotics response protein LiaF n=1 Tax=Exiguobacterium flavidum TaxID=2184695 RepID=UPI000DF82C5F|nr:cell wall-active antibiotics response protein LiaF [Exiguobacterium flavidum]
MRRWSTKQLVGYLAILFALGLFYDLMTGAGNVLFGVLFPFLLYYVGTYFRRTGHEKLAILFYIVGTVILAGVVLSSAAIGFVMAGGLLYLGLILVTRHSVREFFFSKISPQMQQEEGLTIQPAYSFSTQQELPYVLTDVSEQFLVRDLEIDLTRAYVPEGETLIVISGVIGDVRILLPSGYDYALDASIGFGSVKTDSRRIPTFFNRRIQFRAPQYADAGRKIRVHVMLAVGNVEVSSI